MPPGNPEQWHIKRLAWGVIYHQLVAWGIQTEKSYHFSMPNKSGGISELRISLAVSAQQLVLVESYYALGHFMSKSDGAMAAIFFASRMDRHWGKNPSKYWGTNAFLRLFSYKHIQGGEVKQSESRHWCFFSLIRSLTSSNKFATMCHDVPSIFPPI